MPQLRREGSVRRRLRELQHRLFGDRAKEPLFRAVGCEAGAEKFAAPFLQAVRSEVQGLRPSMARDAATAATPSRRSEEHTSELQSQSNLVCRLLLEKKKKKINITNISNEKITFYSI